MCADGLTNVRRLIQGLRKLPWRLFPKQRRRHESRILDGEPKAFEEHSDHFSATSISYNKDTYTAVKYSPPSAGSSFDPPSVLCQTRTPTDVYPNSTDQTTPLQGGYGTDPIKEVDPRQRVALQVSSEDNDGWVFPAFIITADGRKEGALMSLDTQSGTNLLSVERWRDLGLALEPYHVTVLPLQSRSTNPAGIATRGIIRNVDWHFAGGTATYMSDFLVIDMTEYDAILGQVDIKRYRLLDPGPGLRRPVEVRD
ncbi:hypothetical protein EYZ11_011687 [Aspergillus tanneri]|uniref:Uncharacterized protein n=1 Tax=Aspergillus tanneri TaxID=1220188 RepID=A0A4S3J4B4_9EURO|nr:uncharacterized protein ATNIH1004_003582 [Aspergillus tanneri]KAA8650893.1 hypothetical protein ATNIH1004_003582 [Aspergillus tanneri]THC88868.1 hypothetical protein EYZ11_011687 [Aspergillus tanneri]